MLDQRLRRLPNSERLRRLSNSEQTLGQHIVFAGT